MPARGCPRVALEARILLADIRKRSAVERSPEGRQFGRDRHPPDREPRPCDPDEAAHRGVAEDRTSKDKPSEDAPYELSDRPARGRRGARHDFVELPRIDRRAFVDRCTHEIAVALPKLDAPGDAGRGRAEPAKRRHRASQALWHKRLVLERQPPPLAKPVLVQREHRRVTAARELGDLSGDGGVRTVAADVHGDVGGYDRADLRQQIRHVLRLEVREQEEPLRSRCYVWTRRRLPAPAKRTRRHGGESAKPGSAARATPRRPTTFAGS